MDDVEQLQKIDACFNNYLQRDCGDCGAHYSKNGGCCFGKRYDGSHEECRECPFGDDCKEEYEELNRLKTPVRTATTARTVIPANPARPVIMPAPSRQVLTQTVVEPVENDELFVRFLKDSVWGAFLGLSEAMRSFFQNHRWR